MNNKLTSYFDKKLRKGSHTWITETLPVVKTKAKNDCGPYLLYHVAALIREKILVEIDVNAFRIKILSDLLGSCDVKSSELNRRILSLHAGSIKL